MGRQVSLTGAEGYFRGRGSVGFVRPVPWQSYPRSSNDSKMSVSMRSHSMLLRYSNFRVVRLPSSPATLTLAHALPPRNFQITAGASAPALRMSRACARNLIPPAAPPLPAPDRRAVQFCTCVLMNSEAGGPKKGRRTGCVASWAWGPGDAGALYPLSVGYTHVRVVGLRGPGGAWGISRLGWVLAVKMSL